MPNVIASSAYGPVLYSAIEQTLPANRRIVDDPLATAMLPGYMRAIVTACRWSPVRHLLFRMLEKSTPGLHLAILCRKRYIEDQLVSVLAGGLDAVVSLGAGLDTLAYRLPALDNVPVYEVDLPENITYKRQRLKTLFGSVPAYVQLIPSDFETQRLDDVLAAADAPVTGKTAFIWEGVTQYLTESAVRDTLAVTAQAAPGSVLLFTYIRRSFIDGSDRANLDGIYRRMRVDHTYWRFGLSPDEVDAVLAPYGWDVVEHVSGDAYAQRYTLPAGRTAPVTDIEPAVFAMKSAP